MGIIPYLFFTKIGIVNPDDPTNLATKQTNMRADSFKNLDMTSLDIPKRNHVGAKRNRYSVKMAENYPTGIPSSKVKHGHVHQKRNKQSMNDANMAERHHGLKKNKEFANGYKALENDIEGNFLQFYLFFAATLSRHNFRFY